MASPNVNVTVSVKDLDVFELMTAVIKAADGFARCEHATGCLAQCRCGAGVERNERRTEFYRQLRLINDRLARIPKRTEDD